MIQTHVADRIATLTFHRPEKLNALSQQVISDSIAMLRAWSVDPAVGVIVVTGSGRAFCAGGDVSNMAKDTSRWRTASTGCARGRSFPGCSTGFRRSPSQP
jgi:enoyl-CoA hydratase/carnithine racemase